MAKANPVMRGDIVLGHMIFCPACDCGHVFYNKNCPKQHSWEFNGDTDNPTFSPSMLVKSGKGFKKMCHSFVRDGNIQFLNDCTHDLAGQTVELPEV